MRRILESRNMVIRSFTGMEFRALATDYLGSDNPDLRNLGKDMADTQGFEVSLKDDEPFAKIAVDTLRESRLPREIWREIISK